MTFKHELKNSWNVYRIWKQIQWIFENLELTELKSKHDENMFLKWSSKIKQSENFL